MKVMVVGSGGREHALAWKISGEGHEVLVAPGNPGCGEVAALANVPVHDRQALLAATTEFGPDLVVIGPEDPLISGLADMFRANGFPTFGPNADAARLEGSKAFSKDMMKRSNVPTADYQIFSDPVAAKEFAVSRFGQGGQVAIKASGAALGKGVVVCETEDEAVASIERMLLGREFGEAGRTIVIEDRLFGRELSVLTLVAGDKLQSLPVARDYKQIGDGNTGPNTGGMGAFAPVPDADPGIVGMCEEEVVRPILQTLGQLGIEYRGVLFCGLMVTPSGVKCLEYNVRFGDPETQTVLRLVESGFTDALLACALGGEIPPVTYSDQASVTVVVASQGYPGEPVKGAPVQIGPVSEGTKVFHAGTSVNDGALVTSGGRVLSVSATGRTLAEAREAAYQGVGQIQFAGMQFRTDIGA